MMEEEENGTEARLNGQRSEGGPSEQDPSLAVLQRVLTENGNAVFSPPVSHPQPSSEDIEHLMLVTNKERSRQKPLRVSGPPRPLVLLALAASVLVLVGGGLFVFFRQPPSHGLVVAIALSPADADQSFLFRGASVTQKDLTSTVESGIGRALVGRAVEVEAVFLHLDTLPSGREPADPMALLPPTVHSRYVLVVSQDEVSGGIVFSLLDHVTGATLGRRELAVEGNEPPGKAAQALVSELLAESGVK